jgi:hypothetical protein
MFNFNMQYVPKVVAWFQNIISIKQNKIHTRTLNVNSIKEQRSPFFSRLHRSSLWAPLVDPQTSKSYSISCDTRPRTSSDRCSSFPDSMFQVLIVVNTNTVYDLFHVPQEIKIQGVLSGERGVVKPHREFWNTLYSAGVRKVTERCRTVLLPRFGSDVSINYEYITS